MKKRLSVAMAAAILVPLVGCASSESAQDPAASLNSRMAALGGGPIDTEDREALIDVISGNLRRAGMSDVQILCMEGDLATWDLSWLQYLANNFDENIKDGPAGMPMRLAEATAKCLSFE